MLGLFAKILSRRSNTAQQQSLFLRTEYQHSIGKTPADMTHRFTGQDPPRLAQPLACPIRVLGSAKLHFDVLLQTAGPDFLALIGIYLEQGRLRTPICPLSSSVRLIHLFFRSVGGIAATLEAEISSGHSTDKGEQSSQRSRHNCRVFKQTSEEQHSHNIGDYSYHKNTPCEPQVVR